MVAWEKPLAELCSGLETEAVLTACCRSRTGLLAAGIGPLTGERARRAVVRELNRCCRVELRDPDSACLLRSLGVRRELLAQDARALILAMRQTGLTKEEALQWVETLWEEEET